jgi:hypothetical protein
MSILLFCLSGWKFFKRASGQDLLALQIRRLRSSVFEIQQFLKGYEN